MKNIFLFTVLMVSTTIFSQKAKITQGDWKDLKGISTYNLVFEYTDLQIPKYDSEEAFLEDKMNKRDDKEEGTGEEFKKNWFADRENRYEPKFIESFNKRFDDNEVKVGKNIDAEYTMKIHTTMLYPGYNVGVMRQNAKLEATLYVYKTETPNNILFSVDYTKVEGYGAMGNDYNSGYRISEGYAKLAKELAKTIQKKAK
ncbi:hypothetical protein SAMN04487989_101868 [Bizionia echini]|uniref:Uncharacterized protein n=1 Tax=Bizionia echini TaxID=649333 RepID=A0A1I4ZJD5_9FLAO|nr:hypothetical protein [Bizionia echini]MBP93304.1 hypothetical protein [Flavobacteriaceae bacterium]SFN50386.1 hypothetical protein SAMN04487989_101868 [Bizionia echini]|tara:strand:+ start:189 stop:788 length:600 start_codon:yes stop_codon:yes gene_type:complete